MSNFDAELERLSSLQSDLDAKYAHRVAKIELGKAQYKEALDQLKELGCSTLENAQERIIFLQEQIHNELLQIEKDLNEDSDLS